MYRESGIPNGKHTQQKHKPVINDATCCLPQPFVTPRPAVCLGRRIGWKTYQEGRYYKKDIGRFMNVLNVWIFFLIYNIIPINLSVHVIYSNAHL